MLKTNNTKQKYMNTFLFLITLASSIVFIEPSPYDLLIILLLLISLIFRTYRYYDSHFLPIFLMVSYIITNLISLFFIKDISTAFLFFSITMYCIVMWLGYVGILSYLDIRSLLTIFNAYTLTAVVVSVIGIVAYFSKIESLDFLLYGSARIKSFFKDPNVFGPFLIPPAGYVLWRSSKKNITIFKTIILILTYIILTTGVLLSFSRAAWGNYVIVMTFFILFVNSKYINKLKLIIILIAILVPFLNYLINNTEAGELFNHRTSLQTYDEDRFSEQQKAIDSLELYPLGFGPGQSEEFLKQSTHSLYIRVFTENGFIGGLIIILFLITTLLRSLVISRQAPEKYREFYKLVTICIIGIIFNSFFVDTLHWRHLWFLLAIPWMNIKNKG